MTSLNYLIGLWVSISLVAMQFLSPILVIGFGALTGKPGAQAMAVSHYATPGLVFLATASAVA